MLEIRSKTGKNCPDFVHKNYIRFDWAIKQNTGLSLDEIEAIPT